MGNSGWTADLDSITIPTDATDDETRIFVGTGSPVAEDLGIEAGITFWGGLSNSPMFPNDPTNQAFVVGVQPGMPDVATFFIVSQDLANGVERQALSVLKDHDLQEITIGDPGSPASTTLTIYANTVNLGANGAQPVKANGSNATGTTGSAVYTNSLTTTLIHGVAFVAPPSGKVMITGKAVATNGNLGASTSMDFEVRDGNAVGSGTIVRASTDATAGLVQAAVAGNLGCIDTADLVTGLTPGNDYNACLTYKTGGSGTATYLRRNIFVLPQLN